MKVAFLGKYELNKFRTNKIISILKKYNFTHIALEDFAFGNYDFQIAVKNAGIKILLWTKLKTAKAMIKLISKHNKFDGVMLDYVRVDDKDFGWKGALSSYNIYSMIKDVKENMCCSDLEFYASVKQEVYDNIYLSCFNRLLWGIPLWLSGKLFDKIFLMTYHQEYGVSIVDVVRITKKLNKLYGNIAPIFQVYQDKPKVKYNLYWRDVRMVAGEFEDKAYFRLGTCNPKSFAEG